MLLMLQEAILNGYVVKENDFIENSILRNFEDLRLRKDFYQKIDTYRSEYFKSELWNFILEQTPMEVFENPKDASDILNHLIQKNINFNDDESAKDFIEDYIGNFLEDESIEYSKSFIDNLSKNMILNEDSIYSYGLKICEDRDIELEENLDMEI